MASSYAAAALSWSASSWLHSFTGQTNEASVMPDRKLAMPVVAQKKAKKTRKIILKEDVEYVGKRGQLIDVKAGFYRNFLLPMGKAQIVTPVLLKEMRMEEERIEAEKLRVKEDAQQLARIFETVGAFKDKRIVSLPEIRETGEYVAELKLHPEVTARVRLNVFAN
ncbi:unnamed protein product [Linum tenue]|uniref:Large ribosomal subunit protein bL9c n=1 Tax=Linum tenue TaxID=586396 RepID=A0AAV0INZ4_9ROSI|nr:unnamed protein product [Linum tenue]